MIKRVLLLGALLASAGCAPLLASLIVVADAAAEIPIEEDVTPSVTGSAAPSTATTAARPPVGETAASATGSTPKAGAASSSQQDAGLIDQAPASSAQQQVSGGNQTSTAGGTPQEVAAPVQVKPEPVPQPGQGGGTFQIEQAVTEITYSNPSDEYHEYLKKHLGK